MSKNLIGLEGIEFVEFTSTNGENLKKLFYDFGFYLKEQSKVKNIFHYTQNQIHFLLNLEKESFAAKFNSIHGPSICSMGWKFQNAERAFQIALARGAKEAKEKDYDLPAVYGIGDSLIYFVDKNNSAWSDFVPTNIKSEVNQIQDKGFVCIDHLTNNVFKGTMKAWADFYKNIFEFSEVRYFDIKGQKTGLTSYALRSADGSFCIPINEADQQKSQINEYLEQYHGPGIQHLAFLTNNILDSLHKLEGSQIQMLDIESGYYDTVFNRVPNVRESQSEIKKRNVLVDGDDEGYLLQIFTKNLVGPIFIEIIQRANHQSFGEGNFQALFNSIERDQEKRGVFNA